MPYYLVTDTQKAEPARLIIAPNAAQAVRHVARRYKAAVASTHDVATLMMDGANVETAGAEQAPE